MRRAASLLVWFALLEGLWVSLVGTAQDTEVVAGLAAAAVGALFAEALRSQGLLAFHADLRLLAQAWKLPHQLVFDFGVVTWVLVRSLAGGRPVRGAWVEARLEPAPGAVGAWRRAFGVVVGTATPNAVVVDIEDDGRALLHSLEPRVKTGRVVV